MPTARKIRSSIVIALALAAGPAIAQLPGSAFDTDDGNLTLDDDRNGSLADPVDDTLDWENAPNLSIGTEAFSGAQDNSFGQGSKEDTPVPTVVNGSIPPNKSDLDRFYVSSETVSDPITGDPEFVVYLAWVRTNVLGTANIDFEFDQQTDVSANGVTNVRKAGDILITFDFASGANKVELSLLRWVTTGSTEQCEANHSLPCWGNRIDLDAAGFAQGKVNDSAVPDPVADPGCDPNLNEGATGACPFLPALTFGEAAINLTDAGVVGTSCQSFARVYTKSRSSDSFTAALKDFIAPIPTNFNRCADINVFKADDAQSDVAGAIFGLFASDGDTDPFDDVVGDPLQTCTTDATGFCQFAELDPGDYWVVELSAGDGYCTSDPAYQHVTLGLANASVTFEDPRLFTVITVVCRESDATLYASLVTLDGQTETSLGPGALTLAQQSFLCGLGGARFEHRTARDHAGQVVIGENCSNGTDDDGDGQVDGADSNCTGPLVCSVEVCDDAADNDGDAFVDCADADCAGDTACP